MKIAGYEFTEGARFQPGAKGDPKIVGEHLELLRQQCKGELTPEDVVKDAENPNSPLHSFFEWKNSRAAHEYRLAQARGLIRTVVAVFVQDDKPAVRTRAYVHIHEPGAPHYRSADHAMSQTKTKRMVLDRALGELVAWKKRYRQLKEFADLFEEIDQLEIKLTAPA